MAPELAGPRRRKLLHNPPKSKGKTFTAFRSAAEEADTKRENDLVKGEQQSWDNEGGHMSSTAGQVTRVPGADLPYVVSLAHHGSEPTEHHFSTMREAEGYIKRNTPVPGAALSTTYDRPASGPGASLSDTEGKEILARLKVIGERLRRISTEDAASVLARGIAKAGIQEQERVRLLAETERILDEIDATNGD
jgi:hypothetical protein